MRTGLRTWDSTSFLTEVSMVAEKNMVWRSAGMTDMIRLMEGRKPMSSMRSASSRTRMLTLLEFDQLAVQEIAKASWGGDHDGGAVADLLELCAFVHAADGDGGADAGAARDFANGFGDLQGQFAGRRQNDAADARLRALVEQQLDGRQYKRKGLSGSGLGGGDEVAAGQCRLDGLGLDGGWLGEVQLREIARQLSRKGEFEKFFI